MKKPESSPLPLTFRAWLWYQALPLNVSFSLSGRRYQRATRPTADLVTAGLCQMRYTLIGQAGDFVGRAYRFVRTAVQRGANFVVFPQYTGSLLLGLLPELGKQTAAAGLAGLAKRLDVDVADLYRVVAPAAVPIYRQTFAELAQRFGVGIAAGSIVMPGKDGRLYDTAHLFGANGALVGVQQRLHLAPGEEDWLAPGTEFQVFELPFGRVALLTGLDGAYWETARAAWLGGADILIQPAADERGDVEPLRARGVRVRVQELPAYGLQAFMLADLFQLHWRGRSAGYAPAGLLPAGQPVLAQARGDNEEEVVLAPLDLAALRQCRRDNTPEFNSALFARYLPALYERGAAARGT